MALLCGCVSLFVTLRCSFNHSTLRWKCPGLAQSPFTATTPLHVFPGIHQPGEKRPG